MRVARMKSLKTLERNNKDLRVIIAAVSLVSINHRLWKKKKSQHGVENNSRSY